MILPMILADVGKVFMVLSSVTKHCQEQRTAPWRRQVGVAPEVRVSGRSLAIICTRGWGPVSSARVLARGAISDERAYAQRP